jgi:hypothetical protein
MTDIIKNLLSILPALLPLLEKQIDLLPVNPLVRQDVWLISMVLAGVAGLGGYQSAKRLYFCRYIGWIGLLLLVPTVLLELGITTTEVNFGFSPPVIQLAVRGGYCLTFLLLGLSIGGFIGLL